MAALPTLSERGEEPRMSSALAQTLRQAEKEMAKLGDEYISTEHLLLALTDAGSGVADVLPDRGVAGEGDRRGPRARTRSPPPTPRTASRRWRNSAAT